MRRLAVLVLLLAAPAARPAPEGASPELASLVPAETLLLVETSDLDGAGRWGEGTALGRLCAEPEVQRFVSQLQASLRQAFAANARQPLAMFGLTPEDFDGIRFRRASLAIVDVTVDRVPSFDAVLLLEMREGAPKVMRILQSLRAAAETFLPVSFGEEEVRGRKVVTTALPGHEICVMAQGDRVIVTTRRARMDDVLKALDEGHPAPLRSAPRVARLRERMGAERSLLFGYVDAPAIARRAVDAWARTNPGEQEGIIARMACTGLGLDAVDAIAMADVPAGAGYRTEVALLLKERRGLFGLVPTAPPTHRFARMTPADALAYGGESFDLAAFWDWALAFAAGFEGPAGVQKWQARLNATLGINLREDLLAALGTEWGGYLAWPDGGGLFPDLVLFASLRDKERAMRTLDALSARAGELVGPRGASVVHAQTEFRGRTIHFLEITDRRGDARPYAPAWAFGEDFLVVGPYPQAVKRALADKPSLAERVEFQQLLAATPRTSASVGYVDLGRVAAWLYATAVPALQVAQAAINRKLAWAGARVNLEDLPPVEVLRRHLTGIATYTALDGDCLRMGYISPVGAPLAAVPAATMAATAVWLVPRGHAEEIRIERAAAMREAEVREREAQSTALRAESERLRAENGMLRERLARLEEQVAELRRLVEERAK